MNTVQTSMADDLRTVTFRAGTVSFVLDLQSKEFEAVQRIAGRQNANGQPIRLRIGERDLQLDPAYGDSLVDAMSMLVLEDYCLDFFDKMVA